MVSTRIIDSEPALILDGDKKNLVIGDATIKFYFTGKYFDKSNTA